MESEIIHKFETNSVKGITYSCHDTQSSCKVQWDQASFQGQSVLQESSYLNSVAHNFQNDMQQFYVVFYKEDAVIGRALFQCGLWEADASYADEPEKDNKGFSLKNWFAKKIKFIGILCGNILLTGEYGFNFDYDQVDKSNVPELISQAARKIKEVYYKDSKHPTAIIAKDLYVTDALNKNWISKGFHQFNVQPNMIMTIDPNWKNFDDYLSSLSSKYRVRTKRAYKKSSNITFREFDDKEIEENLSSIFDYFTSVQKNAGFNLVYLKPNYFLELKRRLGDDFRLYGYYLQDRLIGFNTIIINHDDLEAHFLGFDREVNHSHQLYLTMLYDKIKKAIDLGSKRIIYARTALEIKSSVGAEPRELCIYLRHENAMLNKVVSPIISVLNPAENWVQRHPFK